MSARAEERLKKRQPNKQNFIADHEKLVTIGELLEYISDTVARARIKKTLLEMDDWYDDFKTLTYFAHKNPDLVSTYSAMIDGEVKDRRGEVFKTIRFIRETKPPYKLR
jgi:hypothetical protein